MLTASDGCGSPEQSPVHPIVSVYDFESLDCSAVEGVCTDYAYWARDQIQRGSIWGFRDEDNRGTESGQLAGGHDFLVCDGRWIVDLWSREVGGLSDKVVFDMEDDDQQADIKRLFGDREKWSLVSHESP